MTLDRRSFLALVGVGASSSLIAACNSQGPASSRKLLAWAAAQNEKLEGLLLQHTNLDRVPKGAKVAGDAFPKYYVSDQMPMWDPALRGAWTLEVGGAVRRPMRFSLEQLVALPSMSQRVNHYCVEGWTARADWRGVRVSDLARMVEPTPDAQVVDFRSFDSDYHESWDMESAMHPQTLVVYAMDGRFLGAGHGAPARVHSPIKLGYKNTKYLTQVMFLPSRNGGYWSDKGYEWYGGV